jgi:hypothetical protein
MYAASSCPLPGACVGAPPLSNPIHKTPPTIKYRHQVNCSDKQRKKLGPYQSQEKQSVVIARVSARPKLPHEPIVALEPQWPLLAHCHVLSNLVVIALRKTLHLNKQLECITICPSTNCICQMMHKTMYYLRVTEADNIVVGSR